MNTTRAVPLRAEAELLRHRPRAAAVAPLAAVLAALALALFAALRTPLKDDVAWLLFLAERWLDGAVLYADLIEINPPLIVWISALPVLLARAAGLPVLAVAPVVFAALVLGCAWWAAGILARRGVYADRTAAFSVIGCVLLVLPATEFGQREHLLAAAALPYLALRTAAPPGSGPGRLEAVAVGVLAGLCCALKPWFAVAFALVEAVALVGGGRLAWEVALGAAATGAAFVAAVLLLYPDYLGSVVPLAAALYGEGDPAPAEVLRDSAGLLAGGGAAAALWLAQRRRMARGAAMGTLLVFAAGAAVAFLLQGKGWFYHRLPATAAAVLALLVWAADPRLGPLRRRGIAFAVAVAATLVLVRAPAVQFARSVKNAAVSARGTDGRLVGLVRAEGARSYVAFSRSLDLNFPLVNETGVAYASRFASTWALYGVQARAGAPGLPPVARWMAADFLAVRPDLVVVDDSDGLDYLGLLGAADPRFAAAIAEYRQIAAFDDLRVFRRAAGDHVVGCGTPLPRTAACSGCRPDADALRPLGRPFRTVAAVRDGAVPLAGLQPLAAAPAPFGGRWAFHAGPVVAGRPGVEAGHPGDDPHHPFPGGVPPASMGAAARAGRRSGTGRAATRADGRTGRPPRAPTAAAVPPSRGVARSGDGRRQRPRTTPGRFGAAMARGALPGLWTAAAAQGRSRSRIWRPK